MKYNFLFIVDFIGIVNYSIILLSVSVRVFVMIFMIKVVIRIYRGIVWFIWIYVSCKYSKML